MKNGGKKVYGCFGRLWEMMMEVGVDDGGWRKNDLNVALSDS